MKVEELKDGVRLIDLEASDWAEVSDRLGEAWTSVADAVAVWLGKKPTWKWDRLRIYSRFGSGLLWISADPEKPTRNANIVGIRIRCLEVLYHALPDPETDEAKFERAHQRMVSKVAKILRESVKSSLAPLQQLQPHPLTMVEYDDMETEQTLLSAKELAAPKQ